MSLEKAIDCLIALGLTDKDAFVYVILSKRGSHTEKDLVYTLNLTADELQLSLVTLLDKRMIRCIQEPSNRYFAIPFEKIIDEKIETANDKARALLANRSALLDSWRHINQK